MPKVTVYIRNSDLLVWKDIEHKTEFMHQALRGHTPAPRINQEKKIKKQIREVISQVDGKVCPTHGTPLTEGGKCLQKGCKFS